MVQAQDGSTKKKWRTVFRQFSGAFESVLSNASESKAASSVLLGLPMGRAPQKGWLFEFIRAPSKGRMPFAETLKSRKNAALFDEIAAEDWERLASSRAIQRIMRVCWDSPITIEDE